MVTIGPMPYRHRQGRGREYIMQSTGHAPCASVARGGGRRPGRAEGRMQTSEHWERVYATKSADTVSWYQRRASLSLDLIGRSGIAAGARIIDVGGGASPLAGDLLAAGYTDVTVLDVPARSEEHTAELQSPFKILCGLLLATDKTASD